MDLQEDDDEQQQQQQEDLEEEIGCTAFCRMFSFGECAYQCDRKRRRRLGKTTDDPFVGR